MSWRRGTSVLTASKVWVRKGTLAPSLAASGLALMRPHLLSAKFLHVQIPNLELNAKFVSPKGLKVPWHVALVAAESGLEKKPVGAGRADGNAGRNTPHADTK